MSRPRIYLDHNASAPLRPEARAAMLATLDLLGNPSSVHAEGRSARAAVEQARGAIARLAGVAAERVVLTSGATEANATVLAAGWDVILAPGVEHLSVLKPAERSGARVVEVPVIAGTGVIDLSALERLLAEHAGDGRRLLCLQHANNETGVLQPVPSAIALARRQGWQVHCDAAQTAGRLAISPGDLDADGLGPDFVALSAHKLGGPKGVGAVVLGPRADLPALIAGGGQERGRRAGTPNVAGIVGFGAAAEVAAGELPAMARVRQLRDALEAGAVDSGSLVIGTDAPRLPNTVALAAPGLRAETLVIALDLDGIAVGAGSACSSGKVGRSHVLAAMAVPDDIARAAIRVSVGPTTTSADVDRFIQAWRRHAGRPADARNSFSSSAGQAAPRAVPSDFSGVM